MFYFVVYLLPPDTFLYSLCISILPFQYRFSVVWGEVEFSIVKLLPYACQMNF